MIRKVLKGALIVVAAALVLSATAFAWVKWAPRRVPAGQPALATLNADSLATFRGSFNAAAGDVRVLALLSPT